MRQSISGIDLCFFITAEGGHFAHTWRSCTLMHFHICWFCSVCTVLSLTLLLHLAESMGSYYRAAV